jgi:hypothetical protein
VLDFTAQVVDLNVDLLVGVYGGALDSVYDCQHCGVAPSKGDGLLDSGGYGDPLDRFHGSLLCGDPLSLLGGLLGGSVNVNGLLCGGPLKGGGGIGGGLLGGGVGDGLRCGGVDAELLRLQLRIDASVGGGGGGLFGGGVGDSLCSDGASAELRDVLLLL